MASLVIAVCLGQNHRSKISFPLEKTPETQLPRVFNVMPRFSLFFFLNGAALKNANKERLFSP